MATTKDWKTIADEKARSVFETIPKEWLLPESYMVDVDETSTKDVTSVPRECGILTPEEVDITESYDATDLLAKIAAGQFSSTAVATAFCKRAAIAQQLVR